MKLKRILSTALTVVMIFTAMVAVIPTFVDAAHSQSSASVSFGVPTGYEEANLSTDAIKTYLTDTVLKYDYMDPYELLQYELEGGYLYRMDSANSLYSLYINKYTGMIYYLNNVTGQILTSNPSNIGERDQYKNPLIAGDSAKLIMSQIQVQFFDAANSQTRYNYNSFTEAAMRGQISVSPIKNGVRVSYVIGDTTARYLLPGIITEETFREYIINPMITHFEELLAPLAEIYPDEDYSFYGNDDYVQFTDYGYVNIDTVYGLFAYLDANVSKAMKANMQGKLSAAAYKEIFDMKSNIINILGSNYICYSPEEMLDKSEDAYNGLVKTYPITGEGVTIYAYTGSNKNEVKNKTANLIRKFCPDFTFAMMYAEEKRCGYVDNSIQKPVIRCSLEYTFNADGSLSVRLPANSITYDEAMYTLDRITPLQNFGSADMRNDGYIFYPDGSGMIFEFEDFYDESTDKKIAFTNPDGNIYGKDYCYSELTGIYCAQVSMPVYGIVNEVVATDRTQLLYGKETVTNGFFAIIEDGDALATLQFNSGGPAHRFGTAYASYMPRPSDEYNLSETISVGSLGTYIMVADTKYSGSYVTRYVMLTDSEIGDAVYGKDAYYSSTYSGMAAYYRNFLKDNGTLTAIENLNETLPLYMDVFGSMQIVDRILTFPVNTSIPLTEFDDVVEMYKQLSGAVDYVNSKIAELEKLLSEETKDIIQKNVYERELESYRDIIDKVQNITNVNFRLTGFANGGMYYEYPNKVEWEDACGGEDGIKNLIAATNAAKEKGMHFGVYPDFDFAYLNNSSMFDGVSYKGNVSKMVDNRYAKRQLYDVVALSYVEDKNQLSLIMNPAVFSSFYDDFNEDFSKSGFESISLSTLGSSLNSSFDKENAVNREDAKDYVTALLNKVVNENNYDLMIDSGNIYAVKYASHILNIETDSSSLRYSSYVIPFVGMVLHSYVSYSGMPLNYSASPEYDLLRHIENGAALQYVACFRNSAYLKEDPYLSKYYGVDYTNWYTYILENYYILNEAIGNLQDYEIVDHTTLYAERVIEEKEKAANIVRLVEEALVLVETQLSDTIDLALDGLRKSGASTNVRIKLSIDRDALVEQISSCINLDRAELDTGVFKEGLDRIVSEYEAEYAGSVNEADNYLVEFSAIKYETKYSYTTDSFAADDDYQKTDYTVGSGKITIVTYKKGNDTVRFLLNYNNFSVVVNLDENTTISLEKYAFVKL